MLAPDRGREVVALREPPSCCAADRDQDHTRPNAALASPARANDLRHEVGRLARGEHVRRDRDRRRRHARRGAVRHADDDVLVVELGAARLALREPVAHDFPLLRDLLTEDLLHVFGDLAYARERVDCARRFLAALRIAFERLHRHGFERGVDLGGDVAKARDGLEEHAVQGVGFAFTLEESLVGEHFPQDGADREDVGPPIDHPAARLLRRHVGELALELTRARRREPRRRARDAEVRDARGAVDADEDVLRRHVAVNQVEVAIVVVFELVSRVKSGERVQHDAVGDGNGNALAARCGAREKARQRVPLDVFHHEVVAAVGRAHFEDGHDVRMMDRCGQARLVEEHLDELLFAGQVRVQSFDRDETLEAADAEDTSQKHSGHATGREFGDQLVAIEPLLTPSIKKLYSRQSRTILVRNVPQLRRLRHPETPPPVE